MVRAEEADDAAWGGEQGSEGGNEVERAAVGLEPLLCDGSADDGSAEAGDDGDGSHDEGGGLLRAAVDALEEGRHPDGDAADGESDGRIAKDGADVGLVLQQREDGSLLDPGLAFGASAARGLLHEEGDEQGDDDSGNSGDDEGGAPAEVGADETADEVAEGGSDGDGDVEDGEDAVALVLGVEVGEDSGGEDAEGGLADAEGGVAEIERIEGVDGGGEEVDGGPEEGGGNDHGLAGKAVAEPSGDGRRSHVGDHEPEDEGAEFRIGDVELVLDLLLDAGEDVAVDVVYEVERGEEDERDRGACDGES